MAFEWAKPGSKCVCISGGTPTCDGALITGGYPITNGIYTIDGISYDADFRIHLLHLAEFPTTEMRRGGLRGWNASRFRPLTTQESDIELFNKLLSPSPLERLDLLAERLDELYNTDAG